MMTTMRDVQAGGRHRLPALTRATAESKSAIHWGVAHGLPRAVFRMAAHRGDPQGALITASSSGDPDRVWEVIEDIRSRGTLYRAGLAYLTVDHAVVREVLSSNDVRSGPPQFSSGMLARLAGWSTSEAIHPLEPPSLLVTEPPEHTRYRKLIGRVLTVRAVARLRHRVEQIAGELLDAMDPSGPVDLVTAYCGLLPVTVIAEILGVPPSERERVLTMGTAAAASLDMGLPWRQYRQVDAALTSFDAWLTRHLEHLRQHPGDNLMSRLAATRDEQGGLTERELKSTAGLVLAAGFETTVNLLGNGIRLLWEHPDQLQRLRREPGLWPNAVEEVLRFDPPVLLTGRTTLRETTFAGRRVPSGAMVTTVLGGANRDPKVFTDPARFDVTRPNANEHISFSFGRHYCPGASLARMEGEVGLRAVFERFPDLTLLPGARRRSTRILRGFDALPARLT